MSKKYISSVFTIVVFVCVIMICPSYATNDPDDIVEQAKSVQKSYDDMYNEYEKLLQISTGPSVSCVDIIKEEEEKILKYKVIFADKSVDVLKKNPSSSFGSDLYSMAVSRMISLFSKQLDIKKEYEDSFRMDTLKKKCDADILEIEKVLKIYSDMAKQDDDFCKNVYQTDIRNVNNYIKVRNSETEQMEIALQNMEKFKKELSGNSSVNYYEKKFNSLHKNCTFRLGMINNIQSNYDIVKRSSDEYKYVKKMLVNIKAELDISEDMDELTILRKINQYICDNYSYGSETKEYSFIKCMEMHKIVCWGYARLFKLICEEYGFEVGEISGWSKENGGHSWNAVKLDGKVYQVDVTWNDSLNCDDYFMKESFEDHSKFVTSGIYWTKYMQDFLLFSL